MGVEAFILEILRRPGPPLEQERDFLIELRDKFWDWESLPNVGNPLRHFALTKMHEDWIGLKEFAFNEFIRTGNLNVPPEEVIAGFRQSQEEAAKSSE